MEQKLDFEQDSLDQEQEEDSNFASLEKRTQFVFKCPVDGKMQPTLKSEKDLHVNMDMAEQIELIISTNSAITSSKPITSSTIMQNKHKTPSGGGFKSFKN
jgi:hypothetical protein